MTLSFSRVSNIFISFLMTFHYLASFSTCNNKFDSTSPLDPISTGIKVIYPLTFLNKLHFTTEASYLFKLWKLIFMKFHNIYFVQYFALKSFCKCSNTFVSHCTKLCCSFHCLNVLLNFGNFYTRFITLQSTHLAAMQNWHFTVTTFRRLNDSYRQKVECLQTVKTFCFFSIVVAEVKEQIKQASLYVAPGRAPAW